MAKTKSASYSAEEKAAMKERAEELKREKRGADEAEEAKAVLAKIASMPDADRRLAERIHEIVLAAAPGLRAKLWYGMPAYYNADGKNVCFFQDAAKFKARYATFGFNEAAKLDDGNVWPTSFALLELTPEDESRITAIVRRAVS